MLHEFLADNRSELVARCRAKVATREHSAAEELLKNGVPMLLEQLIRILRAEQEHAIIDDRLTHGAVGASAALHGQDMLALGFSVDEVVHNYGDLCQAITDLAVERNAPFSVDEFRTLNHCLDYAIAYAVTAFSSRRDFIESDRHSAEENKRMGFFVHELRNLLGTAKLAFTACQTGHLSLSGATGNILQRNLDSLESLIDDAVTLVRVEHLEGRRDLFSLADFAAEVRSTSNLAAIAKQCRLNVPHVDPGLAIRGNRPMLLAAVVNLLQNAFKFTHLHTDVTLACHAVDDAILIDVSDHCGGIGDDVAKRMFQPFEQGGPDRTGLGLGLTIARQFVHENGGTLSVRDIPDTGCVFTITLPRHVLPTIAH
jgi:signal transduction histidine kinase